MQRKRHKLKGALLNYFTASDVLVQSENTIQEPAQRVLRLFFSLHCQWLFFYKTVKKELLGTKLNHIKLKKTLAKLVSINFPSQAFIKKKKKSC